jgi:hypothetical protein
MKCSELLTILSLSLTLLLYMCPLSPLCVCPPSPLCVPSFSSVCVPSSSMCTLLLYICPLPSMPSSSVCALLHLACVPSSSLLYVQLMSTRVISSNVFCFFFQGFVFFLVFLVFFFVFFLCHCRPYIPRNFL